MPTLAEKVASVPFWWHSIDLGDGVVTPGAVSSEALAFQVASLQLPDLRGKRVLDIGTWDGFYAFLAERRGAAEVVALDHYAWSMDLAARVRYVETCRANGVPIQPYHERPEVWQPDTLPGRRGFDLAHATLGSSVKPVVGDFMTMDLEPLGTFDVVFFLGVLYHLTDPLGGLQRVRSLTSGVAIIETEAIAVAGFEECPMCRFFPGAELADDPTNWFVPNRTGLLALVEAAGFARAEPLTAPWSAIDAPPGTLPHYRAVAHAWAG